MTGYTAVLLAVVALFTLVPAAQALRGRRRFGLVDRAGAVGSVASAFFVTVLARQVAPWGEVPAAAWALPVAATTAAALGAVACWRDLPTLTRPRWWRATGAATNVAVTVALLVVVVVG